MLWSPDVQGLLAVFAIGALLFGAHIASVKVNASGSAG